MIVVARGPGRARLGVLAWAWLAACGPAAPTSVSLDVDADTEDHAVLSVRLLGEGHATRADGRIDVWIDTVGAPHASSRCHLVADVTAAQFRGERADLVVPFPPGCDATVPGRAPPYRVYATFTMRDGAVAVGEGNCTERVRDRITHREPTPVAAALTTASCDSPVAEECVEWTVPADQLADRRALLCPGASGWSLAPCRREGAVAHCTTPTDDTFFYGLADGVHQQCVSSGGRFETLP